MVLATVDEFEHLPETAHAVVLVRERRTARKRKSHVLVVKRKRFKERARLLECLEVGCHERASERGRPVERRRRRLEGREVSANGRHELSEHVWSEHGRRCDNEEAGLSGEVRGSNAQCGAGAPLSLSSPMARHAQEERPLRSCHDSSNSAGGMCGGGLLAQAPAGYMAAARRKMATGASTTLSAVLTGSGCRHAVRASRRSTQDWLRAYRSPYSRSRGRRWPF